MKSASGRSAKVLCFSRARSGQSSCSRKPASTIALYSWRSAAAERGEERLLGRIMLVLHDRRHHAGRGRGEERLGERVAGRVERRAEVGAFGLDLAGVRIRDGADRLRQAADVVDRFLLQRGLVGLLHEDRIALDVGALAPLPRAAEPGQPVADVEQERVALLLAIVADVDARFGLLRHDGVHRRLAGRLQLRRIDRLAARAARIEPGQLDRARQAAGMGGEDPLLASTHALPAAECRHFSPASSRRSGVKAKPVCAAQTLHAQRLTVAKRPALGTRPHAAFRRVPSTQDRLRRRISSITAALSRSPSPRETQAASTSALSAASGSSCPRLAPCSRIRRKSFNDWWMKPCGAVVAAHHLRALDVHHLRIGGRLPRHVEEGRGLEPERLREHQALRRARGGSGPSMWLIASLARPPLPAAPM